MGKRKHTGKRRGRSKLARQIAYLTRGMSDLNVADIAAITRASGHGKDVESVERALKVADK